MSLPSAPVCAIGLGRRGETDVEDDTSVRREFCEGAPIAPADEQVAARERLRVALAAGEQPGGVREAREQTGGLRGHVHGDVQGARLLLLRRRGRIVEQGDGAVGHQPCVVLPFELHSGSQRDTAAPAAELP